MDLEPSASNPQAPEATIYRISEIIAPTTTAAGWTLPEIPETVCPAGLTALLKQLPALQSALLPRSRTTLAAANRRLRAVPDIPPCSATVKGNHHAALGQAVDRAALVRMGGNIIQVPMGHIRHRQPRWTWVMRAIELAPLDSNADFLDPPTLGALFLLGRMRSWQRGFIPFHHLFQQIPPIAGDPGREEAHAWLAAEAPSDVRDELAELLVGVEPLLLPGPYHLNPVFGGLGPILGSDGDWIAGSTLVELKVVRRGLERSHVAQVLLYAFLAEHSDFAESLPPIAKLALCLPRHRALIIGSPDEWLAAFGAPPAQVVFPVLHSRLTRPPLEIQA